MPKSNRSSLVLALTLAMTALSQVRAQTDQAPAPTRPQEKTGGFTRFVSTGELAGRFETAIVRYEDEKGRIVDLLGAVHIADAAYFKALEKAFRDYEALLYELVAPEGALIPEKNKKSSSFVSMLQRFLKNMLDLEFQLDGIDYRSKNFVHADLTAQEFSALQEERGENMLTMMLRMMGEAAQASRENPGKEPPLAALLAALLSDDRASRLKYIFAKQLDQIELMVAGGGNKNSILIHERNKKAFQVLERELEGGKTKLGVFYGAAHLPDMEERLITMGFKRQSERWLTAWDIQSGIEDEVIEIESSSGPVASPPVPTKKL